MNDINSIPDYIIDSVGRLASCAEKISELTGKSVEELYDGIDFDSTELIAPYFFIDINGMPQRCIDPERHTL